MARRDVRGVRRRQELVSAARKLFVERGYRNTTLRDIIALAGGSQEMIYTAFGGKIGLLGAIVSQAGEDFAQLILDAESMSLPPRQGLTRLGLRLMEIWRSPEGRAVHRMVASEGVEAPEILQVWSKGGREPTEAALARYLEVKTERGELDIDNPRRVARQFHLLLLGEMAMPIISDEARQFDPDAAVKSAVDLILRAYGKSERDFAYFSRARGTQS